jgi:6,7-dimethyl-8-ribityllumazine synthase
VAVDPQKTGRTIATMPEHTQSDPLPPVCVIVSRYNAEVTDRLRDAAVETYLARGGVRERLGIVEGPGAFELVVLAATAAESGLYDGLCCLGCVIKGETDHDRYIAEAVAQGLGGIAATTGIPASFGVITANTPEQARDRAGGAKGNKGAEAMAALVDTLLAQEALADAALRGEPAMEFRLEGSAPTKAAAKAGSGT